MTENDSKEKIIEEWNKMWGWPKILKHPMIFSDFNDIYREMIRIARRNGTKERTAGHKNSEEGTKRMNDDDKIAKKLNEGIKKIRMHGQTEFFELYVRAKNIRKRIGDKI